MRARLLFGTPTVLFAALAAAAPPFAPLPDWESADPGDVSTGGALVDLDRDGWLDLVVANGNDIERQPLAVYYNRDGTFPTLPDWTSTAREYHGQLAAGDVNQDGWTDIAVAVFLGAGGFAEEGFAALYLNDGAGRLPATPSWTSADRLFTFGVALGDADADGDLDLAAAYGEVYTNPPGRSRVYLNRGGALEATASWVADEVEHNLACAWGDADGDGDLDLAMAGSGSPHRIHFQSAGALATSAAWRSADAPGIGLRLTFGDLDRDGYAELAVAENNQLDTTRAGQFVIFPGTPGGLGTTPSWRSARSGYGSEAMIGDVNGDGWSDLLCGGWGADDEYADQIRIYSNRWVRPLDADEAFVSATESVIERMLLGDVDNDGVRLESALFPGDATRKLFQLERRPLQALLRVSADGMDLGPRDFCADTESGWISLARAPASELKVEYSWSERLDLVVLNWDSVTGNYVFYGREPAVLYAVKGATRSELALEWTGGQPPFDVLETSDARFGPGLSLRAEGLAGRTWSDLPGSLAGPSPRFYRVE